MKYLEQFIKQFTKEELYREEDIRIQNKEYYYTPKHIQQKLNNNQEEPIQAGLFLGKINNGQFQASLNLLEEINKHTNQSITLPEKQAWLFSCKRDIFKSKEIIDKTTNNIIIINDEEGRVIGLAKKESEKGKELYVPLFDIGEYLRREK
jgi:ribosome biogenesis protein Nip4